MIRLTTTALAAIFAFEPVASLAQTAPSAAPDCHVLSPIAEKACYAAQDAAAKKAADKKTTKLDRKDDLATARSSTAPPQDIAVDLLQGGYASAAAKRYKTQLVSSPGNPIKVNGAFVYTTPAFDPDDRRTALYLQLFRTIGKAMTPPSAAKQAKAQMKAMQRLNALMLARASGQPMAGKHGSNASAAGPSTPAPTSTGASNASTSLVLTQDDALTFVIPPPATNQAAFAVQSVDGVPMMTAIPSNFQVSTTFNSAEIDDNGKGSCTSVASPGSHAADGRTIILQCFAHAVHNLRIQAARDAIREYQKWARDPYGFTPPSGFTYSAPARPVTDGHGHSLSIAGLYSADPAAAPDVRTFGEADAVNAFVGGDDGRAVGNRMLAKLATSNSTDMPLLRVAMGEPAPSTVLYRQLSDLTSGTAAFNEIKSLLGSSASKDASGDAAGGLAGAGIMSNEAAYDALLPYAAKPKFIDGKWIDGIEADEADAGPPGLLAAFLTTMVEAGVDEGEKVFGNKNLPGDLNDELAKAEAASDPSIADLAGSESGRTELFTVFVGGTRHLKW